MFSLVQDKKPLSICDQAKHLADAHRHLQEAYCVLAQMEPDWNPEVDEYLHEEVYAGRTGKQFLSDIADALHEMQTPLFELAVDHRDLCNDLLRVGRGESFSV